MSTFTPTTEGVRNSYIYSAELHDGSLAAPKEVLGAEFDRWLTQHDAEVAAKALEDAVDRFEGGLECGELKSRSEAAPKGWSDASIAAALENADPIIDWLRARAAAIRTQQEGTE